ncbi:MAG: phage tail protein [Ahrensia sp.]|nr:phage tail protein [Ahrensia sp.]
MSEQFNFDQIPYDWVEPGNFMEVRPNYRNAGIFPWPVKSLIIAQKLPSGTLPELTLQEIVNPDDAITFLGQGSIGAAQVKAFRSANRTTPLYVIALEDADGAVKATGGITFSGAISRAVVMRFLIGGKQVRVTFEAADDVDAMASKLADAINDDDELLVTAAAVAGSCNVTCRHGGEIGDEIDLRVDARAQPVPDGLTIGIFDMSNGSGNPDVSRVYDEIANLWFTEETHPWVDPTNMAHSAVELRDRYTAMSKLDCHGFYFKRSTYGQLGAFGELTNEPFITAMGLNRSPTPSWEAAASVMGIAAFHLTNDPARQLRSLVVPGLVAPDPADRFTETEQDLLLRRGISTFDHLDDGTTVISRMVTTYKMSNLGTPDRAWMDIMVPRTMSRIRYDWNVYVSLLYPRAKLTDDEEGAAFVGNVEDDEFPGNVVVTPRRMHGSWAARCRLYSDKVWIEDVERTVKESRFGRDPDNDNRMNANQQVKIVGNLMTLAAALEFQV